MAKFWLRHAGQEEPFEVELERADDGRDGEYQYRRGSVHADVEVHDGGDTHSTRERVGVRAGWLRVSGRIVPFHTTRRKDDVLVWLDGRTFTITVVDRTARRVTGAATAASTTDITAAMPGTIRQVDVQAGDTFEAHQPLIIMESMKMEMTLSSPHPGRVKEITCAAGDLVEMGRILARLEPLDADDAS